MGDGAGLERQLDLHEVSLGGVLRINGEGVDVAGYKLDHALALFGAEAVVWIDRHGIDEGALLGAEGAVVVVVVAGRGGDGGRVEVAVHIVLSVKEADGSMGRDVGFTTAEVEDLDLDAAILNADRPWNDGRRGVQSVTMRKLVDETSGRSVHHGTRARQRHRGQSSGLHGDGLRGIEEVLGRLEFPGGVVKGISG